jgi:hypothetical protein
VPPKASDDVDRLYGLPLREFIAARNELARRLRKDGLTEEAAEVAALPKPSIAVWAVNQLARQHRRDVDLLLDAGHRLRAAQGERKADKAQQAFESAREAERDAIRRLTQAAEDVLEAEQGTASRATVDRVTATLRAAAVTEEGRELLARGRLTEELELSGFELAAALAPKGGPGLQRAGRPTEKRGDDVASAREAVTKAKERQRETARRLREGERQAAEARRALEAAEAALAEAQAEAQDAADAVEAADAALKRARRRG